jgi:hypothetical protein
MVAVWPVLLLCAVVALVLYVMMPELRVPIAWTAGAVVTALALYVVADVVRSFSQVRREVEASRRIAISEVQLDDLHLTGSGPDHYRLTGVVHNLSPTYELSDVRFNLTAQDCLRGDCREQAHGFGEVIRRVPPNQAAVFETSIVALPAVAAPLGERRFVYHVFLAATPP